MVFRHIRDLREDKDLTQEKVAAILGIKQNTYSQYETGVIAWTDSVLIKLADYYGVSIDFLLDRTNEPKPPIKTNK